MFIPSFPPLNNAPSNWSTVDLDEPYSRDCPISPWISERIWTIKCDLTDKFIEKHHRFPTAEDNLICIKLYLLALSTFMQDIRI